jgi:hypothetical protein
MPIILKIVETLIAYTQVRLYGYNPSNLRFQYENTSEQDELDVQRALIAFETSLYPAVYQFILRITVKSALKSNCLEFCP